MQKKPNASYSSLSLSRPSPRKLVSPKWESFRQVFLHVPFPSSMQTRANLIRWHVPRELNVNPQRRAKLRQGDQEKVHCSSSSPVQIVPGRISIFKSRGHFFPSPPCVLLLGVSFSCYLPLRLVCSVFVRSCFVTFRALERFADASRRGALRAVEL